MTSEPSTSAEAVIEFLNGIADIFQEGANNPDEIDGLLQRLIALRPPEPVPAGLTARQAAEARMAEAWESDHGPNLAVEAIRLWPGCADAYLFLAAAVDGSPLLSMALFTLASEAATDILGDAYFVEHRGKCWQRPDTRTFMRAMEGVARSYLAAGALDLAADHFAEMLTLNPNDDQGVRYPLTACLLEAQNHEAVTQLLTMYDDGSPPRAYLLALAAFQREGDAASSRTALAAAISASQIMAQYLSGEKSFPQEALDLQVPPEIADAMVFADLMAPAWEATAGATDWLKRWMTPQGPRPAAPSKERRSGPRNLE